MTLNNLRSRKLSRRELLRRFGIAGSGLIATALVGCGGDDGSVADFVDSEPQQDFQQEPVASSTQPLEQTSQQVQVDRTAQASQPAQTASQAKATQPEPASERRLLVPDPQAGNHDNFDNYELQDPAFDPAPGARVDHGVIEGAGYRIELPEQWNGELLLWAHGFRGLNDEGTGHSERLTFDDIPARDVIIGQGFGWATSTYRANGYVPGLGVDDLLRVKDRVAELARPPSRTFIAGGSMGGATAQLMAQEFPDEIAAALAFCPAMGNIWVVDYLVAWHALAHYLIGHEPRQLDVAGMIEWGSALGTVEGSGLRLTPSGEQFVALIKDFTGGERWGFEEGLHQQWNVSFALGAVLWPDIVDSGTPAPGSVIEISGSQPPADTKDHVYSSDRAAGIDLDRLNAEVIRVASDPVRRNDPGIGLPSGQLTVPLLAMTTTGDLFTPIHLTRDYQKLLADRGNSANLVVQPIRRAGHCSFSERESLGALTSIIAWLGFGFAPPGDDLQGDLNVVGTRFTNPFDEGDPLRPPA
ncbi:MAG: hypothetical protein OXH38_01615 [Chloroflexi bacterium]|nr:hypothetical protein [Chloroflexota bacterium]